MSELYSEEEKALGLLGGKHQSHLVQKGKEKKTDLFTRREINTTYFYNYVRWFLYLNRSTALVNLFCPFWPVCGHVCGVVQSVCVCVCVCVHVHVCDHWRLCVRVVRVGAFI